MQTQIACDTIHKYTFAGISLPKHKVFVCIIDCILNLSFVCGSNVRPHFRPPPHSYTVKNYLTNLIRFYKKLADSKTESYKMIEPEHTHTAIKVRVYPFYW